MEKEIQNKDYLISQEAAAKQSRDKLEGNRTGE